MGQKIQSMWYSVSKNQFLYLVTLIQILAIFLSGCGTIASGHTDRTPISENASQANSPSTPTPSASPELIRKVSVTQTPQVKPALIGTVTLWHSWIDNELVGLQSVISKFQQKNPDVIVNLQYVPHDDLFNKFTSGRVEGVPDLLIGPSNWGPELFDAELVADANTIAGPNLFEKIGKVALEAVEYRNVPIGLPIAYSKGIVIFRNQSILPAAPQTFEEYLEEAKSKTRGDIVGAVIDLGFFQSGAYLAACGGKLMDAQGNPLFDNAAGLCWIDLLKRIQESGLPVEMNTNLDLERFQTGKVGFIIAGTWDAARVSEAIGVENLAIDPWPSFDGGDLSGFIETDAIYMSTKVAPENQAATRTLARYFLSPGAQNTLANPKTVAKVPTLIGVEIQDRLMKEALFALEKGTPLPAIPAMDFYWDPMEEALRSILFKGENPEKALQKAAIQIKVREEGIQFDE